MNASQDPLTSDVLLVLQSCAADNPWLPRLKAFECEEADEAFIPFIPLFLSPKTIDIDITFAQDIPNVAVASVIRRFSTLCPDLEYIAFPNLPRHSVITGAISELLLGCNRNILRGFRVDSPSTEEAREVLYQLPRLRHLWAVVQGLTSISTVTLPNLTVIDVEYDDHLDWLRGFRGATLGKLEEARFNSESEQIGDFLSAFESVAITTQAQNTLSSLKFQTSRSWNPKYSSLLSFKQLKELEIEFSCDGGCSSRVDDDIITSLAQAMPKLEVLQLGGAPCRSLTGVTVNGLIGLSCHCPHLSKLRIHFQAASLVNTAASAVTPPPSKSEHVVRREDCALVDLDVGQTPIPAGSASTVALILPQIFPHILNVKYTNQEWKAVVETIKRFRQIGAFVLHSSKARPSYPMTPTDTPPGDAIYAGRPPENGQA